MYWVLIGAWTARPSRYGSKGAAAVAAARCSGARHECLSQILGNVTVAATQKQLPLTTRTTPKQLITSAATVAPALRHVRHKPFLF